MQHQQPLQTLMEAYGKLLHIPAHSEWRINNQDIYTILRDKIAHIINLDAEDVQNFCEAMTKAIKENN